MVLLTTVPVSAPASLATGVMVTVGARPPLLATAAPAVGGATPVVEGAKLVVGGAELSATPASGGTPASASVSSPNRLSMLVPMSEQAARPKLAVSAKARERLLLSPVFAGYPLIFCSPLPAQDPDIAVAPN